MCSNLESRTPREVAEIVVGGADQWFGKSRRTIFEHKIFSSLERSQSLLSVSLQARQLVRYASEAALGDATGPAHRFFVFDDRDSRKRLVNLQFENDP